MVHKRGAKYNRDQLHRNDALGRHSGILTSDMSFFEAIDVSTILDFSSIFLGQTALIYGINLAFDILTIVVTFHVLRCIVNAKPIRALYLLVFDIFAALLFAIGCALSLSAVIDGLGDLANPFFTLLAVFTWDEIAKDVVVEDGFFASTTLLPTSVFISIMIFFILAKPIAVYGRGGLLFMFKRITQDDPIIPANEDKFQPFTLLGILLSVIGALAGTIVAIVKAISVGGV